MRKLVSIAVTVLIFFLIQSAGHASTISGTKVYISNPDDDTLWIRFYLDGGYMGGTISPPNTTKYFNFYRLSEGPHELKIMWKDPDTCKWEEKTANIDGAAKDESVTISVVPQSTTICEKAMAMRRTSVYGSLEVSVRNNDDDALYVMVLLNGERRRERTIARYSTAQFLNILTLTPGTYNISIRWKEPDTKKWYEKSQEVTVGIGENSVILETDEVIYTHEVTKPNSSIDVYIQNIDDDDLWVDVLVDSRYSLKFVKSDAKKYFGRFDKLYPGKHTVKLRWIDPDILRWQKNEFIVYLDRDEEASEIFPTVKNTR